MDVERCIKCFECWHRVENCHIRSSPSTVFDMVDETAKGFLSPPRTKQSIIHLFGKCVNPIYLNAPLPFCVLWSIGFTLSSSLSAPSLTMTVYMEQCLLIINHWIFPHSWTSLTFYLLIKPVMVDKCVFLSIQALDSLSVAAKWCILPQQVG